ncbi:hypothetical protein J6590_066838 [Homalodisca vitripennis]|nr:hypothetical protein J6590_066838 [Homalodisca vitripennis]
MEGGRSGGMEEREERVGRERKRGREIEEKEIEGQRGILTSLPPLAVNHSITGRSDRHFGSNQLTMSRSLSLSLSLSLSPPPCPSLLLSLPPSPNYP